MGKESERFSCSSNQSDFERTGFFKEEKYVESGNYRSFYVELIDISRKFISKQYHLPADVLLTDDLIDLMKKQYHFSGK
jgi:hypothetical protein